MVQIAERPSADEAPWRATGGAGIVVSNLRHTYATQNGAEIAALRNINLTIATNEFVSIVGPSGCGKSTLLQIIAGLTVPTSGTVSVLGLPPGERHSNVSLVFQKPALLPWLDVLGNVLFPLRHMSRAIGDREKAQARELLALMGIADFARMRPGELSGGMQQRVAICRALITDPSILLMDEPFAALDALTREELGIELLRLCTERPKTVLFITHSIPEAVLLSDRVVVMTARPGQIHSEMPIPLPRPRRPEVMRQPIFQSICTDVRDAIH